MSALNLNLTMSEGVAIYKRNHSFAFLPKNFSVTEGKLHRRELQQSNYTINHLGVCKNTSLRPMTTLGSSDPPLDLERPQRIKFKRLDKTAKHIMNILDKEAVEKVKAEREILEIKPGYIVQLKVEVPENKRRVSILKGIVIARRNAGLNSTFRLRRLVAGVGVESVFPL
ncbi:50S ribosomal protein L19, chloroplastic-like isoform X2 [Phalaenopsis equestris]|nr:50S ribosomal protein L19, chloroplastic-like isoform X2 [Phalaenopsis equestris]